METLETNPKKEYRCKPCDKSYSTSQNLWKHNNKYHNENIINNKSKDKPQSTNNKSNDKSNDKSDDKSNKKYKCSICNKLFSKKIYLNKHMQFLHKINVEKSFDKWRV